MAKQETKQAAVPYMYYVAVLVVCLAAMVAATEVREFSVSRKRAAAGGVMAGVLLTLLPHVLAGLKRFFCGNELTEPASVLVVSREKPHIIKSTSQTYNKKDRYAAGYFFQESDRRDQNASLFVQGDVFDTNLSDSQRFWNHYRPSTSSTPQKIEQPASLLHKPGSKSVHHSVGNISESTRRWNAIRPSPSPTRKKEAKNNYFWPF